MTKLNCNEKGLYLLKKFILSFSFIFVCNFSIAHIYTQNDITIDHPYIVKQNDIVKGFVTISNNGNKDIFLNGGNATFSNSLKLHKENGIMKNLDRIIIPAGETFSFKNNNLHIMFEEYNHNIKWFEEHSATLIFNDNIEILVDFDLDEENMNH